MLRARSVFCFVRKRKKNPRKSFGFLFAFVLFTLKHRRESLFRQIQIFVLFTISIGRAFSRPGESFLCEKYKNLHVPWIWNLRSIRNSLLILINLIFIFVYIKHRKFLLHLTDGNPRYCIWERSGDASLSGALSRCWCFIPSPRYLEKYFIVATANRMKSFII